MIKVLLSRGIINTPEVYIYLKEYIKRDFNVLIIAFSFFKKFLNTKEQYEEIYGINGSYTERIKVSFIPYGIKDDQIEVLDYYLDNQTSALEKINKANIIYFPGGAPDEFMDRINEFEISVLLKQKDALFIGSSAGAMIMTDKFYIYPDSDYQKYSIHKGLGIIDDFNVLVHYNKKRNIKKALKWIKKENPKEIYLIPDNGCILIEQKRKILLQEAKISDIK